MQLEPGPPPLVEPKVHFTPSPSRSVGVELEVWLLDPETRDLTPRAAELLAAFEGDPCFKPELFQNIIEINTDVCQTVADVRADLGGKMRRLLAQADAMGIALMCAGTHPKSLWTEQLISEDDRYHQLVRNMAWPARRLLICGQHVHVGMPSGEHAIAVMGALSCYIAHLLSLSASSPYWHGMDTGLASSRIKVFEGLPTAGLPPKVRNWTEFATLMRTLMSAESIKSIREIWWDIRPHPGFGTVEVRILDGVNTLTEICAITAFVQSLSEYLVELYDAGEELPEMRAWTLRENKWRAARFGETAQLVRNERGEQVPLAEHLAALVERLAPYAERLGCADELKGVEVILDHGPSYARQRAFAKREGSLDALVDGLVHEFRHDQPLA